jgi:hypothetical protein
MALLQNIVFLSQYPLKQKAAILTQEKCFWNQNHGNLNKFVGDGNISQKNGIPSAAQAPYSWSWPIKGGGLATFTTINGIGTFTTGNIALGKALQALSPKITGSGTASINLGVVMQFRSLSPKITGEGSLESYMTGVISMQALSGKITGEGLVDASMAALAQMVSTILGCEGTLAGSNLRGTASLAADIVLLGDVITPQTVAAAVWNALAAAYNEDGTMGKALSAAGSAGDPWSGLLANYNDDTTFGAFVKKLLSTGKFIALK